MIVVDHSKLNPKCDYIRTDYIRRIRANAKLVFKFSHVKLIYCNIGKSDAYFVHRNIPAKSALVHFQVFFYLKNTRPNVPLDMLASFVLLVSLQKILFDIYFCANLNTSLNATNVVHILKKRNPLRSTC